MYRIVVFRSLWPIRLIIVKASYPVSARGVQNVARGSCRQRPSILAIRHAVWKERLISVKGFPVSGFQTRNHQAFSRWTASIGSHELPIQNVHRISRFFRPFGRVSWPQGLGGRDLRSVYAQLPHARAQGARVNVEQCRRSARAFYPPVDALESPQN